MRTSTPLLLAMLLVTSLAAFPSFVDAKGSVVGKGASCTADPCAATECNVVQASAHAVGSSSSSASASADVTVESGSTSGGGSSHAFATGVASTSAQASGSSVSGASARASCRADLLIGFHRGALALPGAEDLAVGCLADERVLDAQSFQGRLHLDDAGRAVAVDGRSGLGLALASPDVVYFTVELLAAAVPMDVAGMTATDVVVGVEMRVEDDGARTCAASIVA